MKPKAAKQPKQAKPAVQLKDIEPKKDANGGGRLYTGGVRVAAADIGGDN